MSKMIDLKYPQAWQFSWQSEMQGKSILWEKWQTTVIKDTTEYAVAVWYLDTYLISEDFMSAETDWVYQDFKTYTVVANKTY